eukprot:CAMPEP_0176004792 /NCGR_PEP_ID=MMETSP0120_2-20121206/1875_1 /TAXON_ID=160619 /ORGANISM="Kryptoperidinium foliaceum, Strain CCMP 1326" /LENGTH=546 /DNA_ID=CAMNT_0017337483 /DNA_START=85 /DNA_END=1725 /DNA_ORIENTATION=-
MDVEDTGTSIKREEPVGDQPAVPPTDRAPESDKAPPDPKAEEIKEVSKEAAIADQEHEKNASDAESKSEPQGSAVGSAKEAELEAALKLQKRARNEAFLTAGCGYTKKKSRLLSAFWGTMWKELERAGWKKIDGTGDKEGSMRFFPPVPKDKNFDDVAKEGRRGKDYYDRIVDVIGRVKRGRNNDEKRAFELFHKVYDTEEKRKPRLTALGKRRRKSPSSAASTGSGSEDEPIVSLRRKQPPMTMDLSWKSGGTLYPKASSRVGDEFQATHIPATGTHTRGDQSDLYECLWDPTSNKNSIIPKILEDKVPPNKREQALVAFSQVDLGDLASTDSLPENIVETIMNLKAIDGSDWSREEKETYHKEIFRLRKDMTALAKSIGKDLKSCYTYYLAKYKQSDEYRVLKTICVEERIEKTYLGGHHGVDACAVCGDGGSLIICDGCEGEYHIDCLRPRLTAVPEGHWECDECVNKKLLKARELIITKSELYEPHQESGDTGKSRDNQDDENMETASSDLVFRPTPGVLAAVKQFAVQMEKVFTTTSSTTA